MRHGASGLINVQLVRCGIDGTGAEALANALKVTTLSSASSVEYLSLEGNPIGDDGVIALANALRDNQTLTILVLCRHCQVGDAGVIELSDTLRYHNTSLKELDISDNPDVRIRGKEALVDALRENPTLVTTGMRVTHRHPLRPTVVEQLVDLLHINAVRHQWNSYVQKQQQQFGTLSHSSDCTSHQRRRRNVQPRKSVPHGLSPTIVLPKKKHDSDKRSNEEPLPLLNSSLLPYYLSKVASKPSVLYLSLQENSDMILPYL